MGEILHLIARETQGECFTSFNYCYDNEAASTIEYDNGESSYINLKEYAEDDHNPKPRYMRNRAEICVHGVPLFKYFLDGSRSVY